MYMMFILYEIQIISYIYNTIPKFYDQSMIKALSLAHLFYTKFDKIVHILQQHCSYNFFLAFSFFELKIKQLRSKRFQITRCEMR
uniref:Uncharacterized protein n=1 Tax=Pinctada fucata TaxID=50426 RepID=A0A194APH7_PINFU